MKIIAFAASSSSQSINNKLVQYATSLISNAQVEVLDINDYEMPLFSEDREKELGHPQAAQSFFEKLTQADAILISFAEHNGSYTAAFKNLFDWVSRIDMKVYQGKPVVMLATSPGPGGAANVLAAAVNSAPYFGGEVVGQASVSRFYDHFDAESMQIRSETVKALVLEALSGLEQYR
ncbi:NADPH-dependent FMN reductase [Paraferrimonas haliotis]|uniref:FMN reductase n=1 Tax=Paraferrimonas haliotis TaxID=2013866 RepID=A0AA37TQJ9_9GAMM|nr:NAD(P)H-dependent oxidoreductase [Paraferrimonas haliotis]GLS82452.1 FMN reductase [Paraferrimonas haliotis]